MVWGHDEKGRDLCRKKGVEDGTTKEEEDEETKEEVRIWTW